ncbi:MAG: FG-GAP-like repeat-containing protein [Planctomycetota bacterium]
MKRKPFGRLGRIEKLENRRLMAVDVLSALPDQAVAPGAAPAVISLAGRYDDTDVTGTIVRFDVNSPAPLDKVYVELFDKEGPGRLRTTPATAANFLSYVDGGHYQNTFIHRSVPGFVVQGGGFKVTAGSPIKIDNVTQFAAVVNEPKPSGTTAPNNVRGTIAMAKLGSDPNSATNQWFFNLADNSANLDNQNGGFTAFGRVLGNGMAAVDAMAAVPRFGYASPVDTIPLRNVPGANPSTNPNFTNAAVDTNTLTADQFVKFAQIVRVGELVYTATSSSPTLVTPVIQTDGSLKLTYAPGAVGTGVVTVRATSVFDATKFVEDAFSVTVAPPLPPPANAIIGMSGDELVISRFPSGGFTTNALATLPAGNTWAAQVAGDFNGDGRGDFAAASSTGDWWVTLTPASGTATPTVWANLPIFQFPSVGDFNGDGKADIAVRNATNGSWRFLTSNGSAFSSVKAGTWATGVVWDGVRAGDFNGDGKTDLVGLNTGDGNWSVSLSNGSTLATSVWANLPVSQFTTVGDFNGDGKADLFVRNPTNGSLRFLTSTGSAFSSVKAGTWATGIAWDNVRAGDFNGDGKTDLVSQNTRDGSWSVSLSNGSSLTTSVWASLTSTQFATVGDFNGDGKADILVRNSSNGFWRLLASTGSSFTSTKVGAWPTSKVWSVALGVRG